MPHCSPGLPRVCRAAGDVGGGCGCAATPRDRSLAVASRTKGEGQKGDDTRTTADGSGWPSPVGCPAASGHRPVRQIELRAGGKGGPGGCGGIAELIRGAGATQTLTHFRHPGGRGDTSCGGGSGGWTFMAHTQQGPRVSADAACRPAASASGTARVRRMNELRSMAGAFLMRGRSPRPVVVLSWGRRCDEHHAAPSSMRERRRSLDHRPNGDRSGRRSADFPASCSPRRSRSLQHRARRRNRVISSNRPARKRPPYLHCGQQLPEGAAVALPVR